VRLEGFGDIRNLRVVALDSTEVLIYSKLHCVTFHCLNCLAASRETDSVSSLSEQRSK
jgi:hypothetical protein